MSAYIPTNVISITDGQIFLETDLFNAGQRPALNIGISVSRVGLGGADEGDEEGRRAAQARPGAVPRAGGVRPVRVGPRQGHARPADPRREAQSEVIKQPQYQPLPVEKQVAILYAATTGKLDDVPTPRVKEFETQFYRFLETEHPSVLKDARREQGRSPTSSPRPSTRRSSSSARASSPSECAEPASARSGGESPPSATSSRSPGRCSSSPRRSSSAPRTRRSQSRPYSEKLDEVLADLAAVLGGEEHPLLARREGGKRADRPDHDATAASPGRSTRTRSGSPPSEITEHAGRPRPSSPSAARAATRCAAPRVPLEAHFEGFGDRPTFADVLPARPARHRRLPRRDVQPGRHRLQPRSSRR